MAIRTEIFRRGATYVAVRFIRLTSKDRLEPGTVIKLGKYRTHQMRNWWSRRMIGVKDSPWAKQMLNALSKQKSKPIDAELVPYKQGKKWVLPGYEEDISFRTKKEAAEWATTETKRISDAKKADEEAAAAEAQKAADERAKSKSESDAAESGSSEEGGDTESAPNPLGNELDEDNQSESHFESGEEGED